MLLCDSRISGTIRRPSPGVYVGGRATQKERTRIVKETGELNLGMPRRARVLRRAELRVIDPLQIRSV